VSIEDVKAHHKAATLNFTAESAYASVSNRVSSVKSNRRQVIFGF
jgi:hypothetical protein